MIPSTSIRNELRKFKKAYGSRCSRQDFFRYMTLSFFRLPAE